MYDRKTLTLAGELKRALRSEFPAAGRLSFADPDFMEILLDYAGRSRSSMVQAAAMTLRGHLNAPAASPRPAADADADTTQEEASAAEPGETPDAPGATDAAEPEKKKGRRVYRGKVIDDD